MLYNGQNSQNSNWLSTKEKTSVLAKFFLNVKQIDDVECACARIKVCLEALDLVHYQRVVAYSMFIAGYPSNYSTPLLD